MENNKEFQVREDVREFIKRGLFKALNTDSEGISSIGAAIGDIVDFNITNYVSEPGSLKTWFSGTYYISNKKLYLSITINKKFNKGVSKIAKLVDMFNKNHPNEEMKPRLLSYDRGYKQLRFTREIVCVETSDIEQFCTQILDLFNNKDYESEIDEILIEISKIGKKKENE